MGDYMPQLKHVLLKVWVKVGCTTKTRFKENNRRCGLSDRRPILVGFETKIYIEREGMPFQPLCSIHFRTAGVVVNVEKTNVTPK